MSSSFDRAPPTSHCEAARVQWRPMCVCARTIVRALSVALAIPNSSTHRQFFDSSAESPFGGRSTVRALWHSSNTGATVELAPLWCRLPSGDSPGLGYRSRRQSCPAVGVLLGHFSFCAARAVQERPRLHLHSVYTLRRLCTGLCRYLYRVLYVACVQARKHLYRVLY